MPRPRTITDERILAAAEEVLRDRGPALTLAEVAARAGVAVGTVAARFGSRQGLLGAVTRAATTRAVAGMRAAADRARTPVAGLRAALVGWFAWLDDPVAAPTSLAALGTDLIDPDLRALLADLFAAVEAEVRRLVRVAAADLPGAPTPARAARLLVAVIQGSALTWAVRPGGRLVTRLGQDVDAVLAGWRHGTPEGTGG